MEITAEQLENVISSIKSNNDRNNEESGIPRNEEDRIVDKNVIKSRGSTFRRGIGRVISTLTGNEKKRTYNAAFEMARAFHDFNKKKEKDEKPATLVAASTKKVESQSNLPDTGIKNMNVKKASLLLGAIAAVVMLASYLWDNFKGIGTWAMKTLGKLPGIVNALHKGLKGFFKGYAKFVGGIADWFKEGLKGAKTGAKGLAKVAGGMKGVLLKAASGLGLKLLKIFKFLPFVGSLASFVFAYKAYSEGKWFRGTLELLSGILNLVPGPGWIISAALDGAMLLYDLTEGSVGKSGAANMAVKAVTYGAKLIPILVKTAKTVGTTLLKGLQFIPFIGGLAGLVLSYMRFKEGDWLKGSIQLISAVLDFIPVAGNTASMIIDGALILWDIYDAKKEEKKEAKGTVKPGGFWSALKGQATKVGQWLVKNIKWIPVFGNLWSLGEGISNIMNGNFKGGMKQVLQGLLFVLPVGIQDSMISGLDWLMSLFSTQDTTGSEMKALPSNNKSFGKTVAEFIKNKMKMLPWWIRKPLEWLGILQADENGASTSPAASMEWAERIAIAFNSVGDIIGNGLDRLKSSVTDVFTSLGSILSSGIAGIVATAREVGSKAAQFAQAPVESFTSWAHDKSQLTAEDLKDVEWASISPDSIAKQAYMETSNLSETSQIPSNMLRDQFAELVKSGEFTGNFKSYKESVLGEESTEELRLLNKNIINAMKEFDTASKTGQNASEHLESVKNLTSLKETLIKDSTVLKETLIKEKTVLQPIVSDDKAEPVKPRMHVPDVQINGQSEIMQETNTLLAANNAMLFDLLNTEKQALNEHKKGKSSVVVQSANKPLGGGAITGNFSSAKEGSKGSYINSPYSLGAATPFTGM